VRQSSPAPVCYTPTGVSLDLFQFAAQQGSFEGIFVDPETKLACDGPDDCLSWQSCFKDCAFELKATTGGAGIGWNLSGPGVNAACLGPGVCVP
jgi:hypothetical protein